MNTIGIYLKQFKLWEAFRISPLNFFVIIIVVVRLQSKSFWLSTLMLLCFDSGVVTLSVTIANEKSEILITMTTCKAATNKLSIRDARFKYFNWSYVYYGIGNRQSKNDLSKGFERKA